MKICLIGASGSIGWPLYNLLKKKIKIIGTFNNNKKKNLIKFSLGRKNSEINLLNKLDEKDVVIFLAAKTNVSWVYKNPHKAYEINCKYTINFLKKLINKRIRIIYLSSAEVFNGKKGFYKESSLPNPVNVYGKSKFKIEKFLKKIKYNNYQIIRTGRTINMSNDYRCMIEDTYKRILNEDAKMAKDNLFTITDVRDFNVGILKLIYLKSNRKYFHICSDQVLTRVKFANIIKNNSRFKKKMNFSIVKFKDISYSEPRAGKNNLSCKITKKILKLKFKKADKLIQEKVKLLDNNHVI